ncbi:MAG: hypothetical protein PF961_13810 [Planctomycetota bacterium]|jgi:hypothetical protein|nr:hypothetical protein [Planctomycetota bacterium]
MIRINLLPPEFRKRQRTSASNPDALGILAGALVAAVVIGFWGYVQFVRIPHAEQLIEQRKKELVVAKREADEVRALEAKVESFKARLKSLDDLVKQKVPWAGTVSDFADMLGRDRWSTPGFQVSCTGLRISKTTAAATRGRSAGEASIRFQFQWDMELVGAEFNLAGKYINGFFLDVKKTDFWFNNGFEGDPVAPYKGDRPEWQEDIERVVINHSLQWERDQNLEAANRKILVERAEAAAAAQAPAKGDG